MSCEMDNDVTNNPIVYDDKISWCYIDKSKIGKF